MKKVYDLVARVAPTNSTVLITGESGTGKEVVARDIHRLSNRAQGPFVPVNVGAIPESLLESELFGHEKGAFTGAEGRRQGLFELASGGTLFLDELGEMPASMQVKLLRVLQDRTIQRLGGNRPIPVDVRILAATNKNLEEAVRDKTFREDLYFRIHVIAIELPPLRERREDIAPLAGFFLSRFSRETGKAVEGLSSGAIELLQSWPFPGNIRELENSIERAVILSNGPLLEREDFPFSGNPIRGMERPPIGGQSPMEEVPPAPGSAHEPGARDTGTTIRDAEKELIRQALERNAGHREKTAGELGITRRTLLNKMREYGL
jgi:two-component system response regulator AtoC